MHTQSSCAELEGGDVEFPGQALHASIASAVLKLPAGQAMQLEASGWNPGLQTHAMGALLADEGVPEFNGHGRQTASPAAR